MTETHVAPTVTVVRDYEAMSELAADAVERLVGQKPEAVFSLPTGSTPLGLFDELLDRVRSGRVDFSRAHLFCLDEYVGVNREDPNSLTGFLDRSFLHGLAEGEDDTLVRSMIDLAHNLGMTAVAEGVETEAVFQQVAELNCDAAQGYYICRPVPVADASAWINDRFALPAADPLGF